eukprot:TRINITY_DN9458_c0_g2_i3.p3 TRINITY_DN9458_c0_g2~~TRINITY_DN9458_c0_g2_i3.p3  ORF type:complete len:123 (-),score=1.18 TRINITY_DN9458_c0_g2_i3:641-1009(-)
MPLTISNPWFSRPCLPSATVTQPEGPTSLIDLAIISPTLSPLAETVATYCISSYFHTQQHFFQALLRLLTVLYRHLFQFPQEIWLADNPCLLSLVMACANTIEVVVPSPASSVVLEAATLIS